MLTADNYFYKGKYSGFKYENVFSGNSQVDRNLLKLYLINKFENFFPVSANEMLLLENFHFEIGETVLRISPISEEFKGDHKEIIESLFNSLIRSGTTLNQFIINFNKNSVEKELLVSGDPSYIEWCIKEVNSFHLPPLKLKGLVDNYYYKFIRY